MKIPTNVGSKYRFIVLAGQRVSQLQKGARPRVVDHSSPYQKLTTIAIMELTEEKLQFKKHELAKELSEAKESKAGEVVAGDA